MVTHLERSASTAYHVLQITRLFVEGELTMKHIVELSSEEYGNEYFRYDSRKEALAGIARLTEECALSQRMTASFGASRWSLEKRPTNASKRRPKWVVSSVPSAARTASTN